MRKLKIGSIKRCTALACLLLALALSVLEATHVHSSANLIGKSGTPCVICACVHASAPVLAFQPSPVLSPVEIVPIPGQRQDKRTANKLKLFIRPPPSA